MRESPSAVDRGARVAPSLHAVSTTTSGSRQHMSTPLARRRILLPSRSLASLYAYAPRSGQGGGSTVERAHTDTAPIWIRRRGDAIAAVIGLVVIVLGMLAVRNGTVTGPEESVFHAVNDLPGAIYPVVW